MKHARSIYKRCSQSIIVMIGYVLMGGCSSGMLSSEINVQQGNDTNLLQPDASTQPYGPSKKSHGDGGLATSTFPISGVDAQSQNGGGNPKADGGTSVPSTYNPPGRHFFIDSAKGLDSNDGLSTAHPFKSLSKISGLGLKPGDGVYLARGSNWNEKFVLSASGTQASPILVSAYGQAPSPLPIVRQVANGQESQHGVDINGTWIILEKIIFKDVHGAGVYVAASASHHVLRDLEIANTGFGVFIEGSYTAVLRNYIHDLHMVNNTPKSVNSDDDFGAAGVVLQGSNNEIAYCKFVHCWAPSEDYIIDGGAVEIWKGVQNSSIHHNWAEDTDGFIEIGGEQGDQVKNIVLAYNVFVASKLNGFIYFNFDGQYAVTVENFIAENNTIYGNTTNEIEPIIGVAGAPTGKELTFRNNIVYIASQYPVIADSPRFIHDHNLFQFVGDGELGFTLGTNEQRADPFFANPLAKNFHLIAASVGAINQGVRGQYTTDFDGRAVPSGGAVDLGAFEYYP